MLAIEPDNYQALYGMAQARRGAPGFPTEDDARTLLMAFNRAPQVADIRIAAASALISRRIYPLAITLLEPVANSPHGGAASTAARTLLERARAGGG